MSGRTVYVLWRNVSSVIVNVLWDCHSAGLTVPRLTMSHSYVVLFCSLAVLDPTVGHTMDLLSPFIPVLCHSDWLFHGESCPRLDVAHPGRAWPSSPACTWHCFFALSLSCISFIRCIFHTLYRGIDRGCSLRYIIIYRQHCAQHKRRYFKLLGDNFEFFIRAVEATRCIDRGEVGMEEFP